jgi:hypothetical protein
VDEGVREPSEFGSAVNGVFVREVPLAAAAWAPSFGTILCGLETMRSAWPTLEHVFSVRVGNRAQGAAAVSEPGLVFSGTRYPLGLLKANPVDLLVIERGALVKPSSLSRPERWEDMIDATPVSSRPKMVFESWPGVAVTWASGPSGKAYVTRWTKRGYATTMRSVSAVQVGGAVAQTRFLVTRTASGEVPLASILSPLAFVSDARPMSNLLTPPGLLA